MAGHSEGVVKGKFCAKRTNKCKDKEEYQKNCDPPPKGWDQEFFWQGQKEITKKYFEAHHILCVACVTEYIAGADGIQRIVKSTEWCVNRKKNMFAMPLWGHTLKHYCRIEDRRNLTLVTRVNNAGVRAPKFKDTPQHDYDHNSNDGYTDEIGEQLKKVANQVKKMSDKKHEAKVEELKTRLNNLSEKYRGILQDRGKRPTGSDGKKGTHAAWQLGKKDPTSDWYLPFSMAATDNVSPRTFPSADGVTLADKIESLVDAFLG